MLLHAEQKDSDKVEVFNHLGKKLSNVRSFDTITNEAEMYVCGTDGQPISHTPGEVLTVKCVLIGGYATKEGVKV